MKRKLLALLYALAGCITAYAYDFAVKNDDGVTIYYQKTPYSSTPTMQTCAVDKSPNKYSGDIKIPSTVEYQGVTYTVTEIGYSAFNGSTNLTSVDLPNTVTSVGAYAFKNCPNLPVENNMRYAGSCLVELTDKTLSTYTIKEGTRFIAENVFMECENLTSVNIPNSVIAIGMQAFFRCYKLESIDIPNSVVTIGNQAFYHCTGLKTVTIPNSVTTIGKNAFYYCPVSTYICDNEDFLSLFMPESMTIGKSVQKIGPLAFKSSNRVTETNNKLASLEILNPSVVIDSQAFLNCIALLEIVLRATQTSILPIITKQGTINGAPVNYVVNMEGYSGSGKRIEGLKPNSTYRCVTYIEINGAKYVVQDFSMKTLDISINNLTCDATASSITLHNSQPMELGDAVLTDAYWKGYTEDVESVTITGLDPSTSMQFTYVVDLSGYKISKDIVFSTQPITIATLPGEPMNTTTALLCAETNLSDEEVNVGFEWRRYEDPETMPSKKVVCAVIDGKLMGALGNLKDDVYYSYRPYYTSDSGKTYYGEWITFLTGDADVYFDPTVRTYDAKVLNEYSAVLKGYALRGSEKIARQGFQYWNAWGGAATRSAVGDVVEVEVSGQKMTHTLTDLKPSTTYNYRTFVVTETGKVMYGEEHTFTTKDDPVSVNDVTEECAIKVVTGYYDLQGRRMQQPAHGINIVRYSDGTTKKFYVK